MGIPLLCSLGGSILINQKTLIDLNLNIYKIKDKIMRNLTIAILTIVASAFTSAAAFAGETSAYNSYTTTNKYNGVSTTDVDAHVSSYEVETTLSQTTKVEAIAE
jgi:hypothetical protein